MKADPERPEQIAERIRKNQPRAFTQTTMDLGQAKRLSEAATLYMHDSMAMPDYGTDQEQNWILGHLITFAHEAIAAAIHAERAQADADAATIAQLRDLILRMRTRLGWQGEDFEREMSELVAALGTVPHA